MLMHVEFNVGLGRLSSRRPSDLPNLCRVWCLEVLGLTCSTLNAAGHTPADWVFKFTRFIKKPWLDQLQRLCGSISPHPASPTSKSLLLWSWGISGTKPTCCRSSSTCTAANMSGQLFWRFMLQHCMSTEDRI